MNPATRGFIAFVVACVVGVATFRLVKNKKTKKQIFVEKAKKSGYFVTGQYVDVKVFPGIRDSKNPQLRDDSVEVKYKYTINGVDYYKRMMFQSRGRIGTDFPSSVTVYYNPANPKKTVCPNEVHPSQQMRSGCMTTIAVTFLSIMIVLSILEFLF